MNATVAHWLLTGAPLELNASSSAEAFEAEQALDAAEAVLSLGGEATVLNVSDAAVNASAAAGNGTRELSATELFLESSRFWIQRVLVPIVVTVGVLGNLVTVVVLTRRRMRSSTNMYLTALAVSDLLYLIFMFSLSIEHYPGIRGPAHRRYWEYKPYGHWLTDANSSSSVWLTVSFTVERYIAVCHPLRGKVLCTESRARTVIAVVFVACALATITTPFEYKVVSEEAGFTVRNSDLGSDETYQTIFYWFSSITFTILPLILLGIFNSFLVWAVHRSQRQRFRMTQVDQNETCSSNQTQENRITIVLISVVVLFMVCQLPSAGTLLYIGLHKFEDPREWLLLRGLGNIFNFLMAIHSSCNFLLYCALSDKYRRTFMLTFFRRCAPPPPPGSAAAASAAFSTGSRLSVRGAASCGGGGAGAGGPARGYSLRVHPAALGGGGGAAGGGAANGSLLAPPFRRHASAYIPRPRPAHAHGPAPPPRFTPDQTLAEVP